MRKYTWDTFRVVQETRDAVTIYFDTRQQPFDYLPGQYLNITCAINGEQVIRSYSFSSSSSDEFPAITVKRIQGGKMSNYLVDNAASIKYWAIEAPFGNFVLDKKVADKSQVVLLAGGSGISPLFAMLKSIDHITDMPLLLYSNKSPEETIFRKELETIEVSKKVKAFYSFTAEDFTASKTNHITGRFSPFSIQSIIRKEIALLEKAHFYICGPQSLMELYEDVLLGMDITREQIHLEYFDPIPVEHILPEQDGTPKDVIINYYQEHFINDEMQTYECTSLIDVQSNQSLLDAIKEHHITIASSCMKGNCGACRAIKTSGEVKMLNNLALTEQDLAEGYILLCQSYPVNEDVSITLS
jgi:ferredoxin-NADP reductase